MRTTLESGAWVEHTPIQDLKGAHSRVLDKAAKMQIAREAVDDDGNVDVPTLIAALDVADFSEKKHDALWALLISAWSFDFPLPQIDKASGIVTGADVLGEIPIDDYREIDILFEPYSKKLNRKADPKGSTTSASNGSSRPSGAHGSRRG